MKYWYHWIVCGRWGKHQESKLDFEHKENTVNKMLVGFFGWNFIWLSFKQMEADIYTNFWRESAAVHICLQSLINILCQVKWFIKIIIVTHLVCWSKTVYTVFF